MALARIFPALRLFTAGLCAYECAAIVVDRPRCPTLSCLAGRHPLLAPTLIAALSLHLIFPVPSTKETP